MGKTAKNSVVCVLIPEPPEVKAVDALKHAIKFAQVASKLVTELSSDEEKGVTKVNVPYFLSVAGMKQLNGIVFWKILLRGFVASILRVLQVCAPDEAATLQLKIL